MPVITLQGIKNSTGATSLTAGLGWALHKQNASVLVIDLSKENFLRLHFNLAYEQPRGWARAVMDGSSWQSSAFRYTSVLDFLPFGKTINTEHDRLKKEFDWNSDFWQTNIAGLLAGQKYDWILVDVPAGASLNNAGNNLCIINPDLTCHIRLQEEKDSQPRALLMNKYNPASKLQKDMYLLWQDTLPNLLPVTIHQDEAMAESFAVKRPVGEYGSNSVAAGELTALADWCRSNFSEPVT